MKSRGATYLLLAAVVAVWGVIGWKILAPQPPDQPIVSITKTAGHTPEPVPDTLRLDYADPFLKQTAPKPAALSVVRSLPPQRSAVKRERIALTHLGTVVSGKQTLHILNIGNDQYEIRQGETAGDFTLRNCDADSLYLTKEGITYGVKRCE